MNPIEQVIRRVDATQRRFTSTAFVFGVVKKFGDDNGGALVSNFGDSVYGVFATVLGLMAWIYLAARVTVYAAEINVVLTRRLWPRAIVQPPLTEADRTSMALQALQNQRRPEQHVEVSFDDRPPGADDGDRAPRTPDQVSPPADDPQV
jgi:hypothetical protein